MISKRVLHAAFLGIRQGGLQVTYWDGDIKTYGKEKPWVSVKFNSPAIAKAMRKNLDLGIGEGYMNGDMEVTGDLADLARLGDANREALNKFLRRGSLRTKPKREHEVPNVQHHYDLGNDFYKLWLDKSMTYSCAYFRTEKDTLEQAQRNKVEHTLQKLNLQKGMRLLDIGSGWGELIIRAAKKYKVTAHGITLSKEQYRATRDRIAAEGLTGRVSVELKHYDELKKPEYFDRVVSVGMYEHVGKANHPKYMVAVDRLLKPAGVSLLHTITQFHDFEMSPFIAKYIFPGSSLPTLEATISHMRDRDFRVADVESMRRHYAKTLDSWWTRFEKHVPEITEMYDERFVRMWRLYLRGSYAGFAYGNLDIHQILSTKGLSDELPLARPT